MPKTCRIKLFQWKKCEKPLVLFISCLNILTSVKKPKINLLLKFGFYILPYKREIWGLPLVNSMPFAAMLMACP